jgi:hypothetical protein
LASHAKGEFSLKHRILLHKIFQLFTLLKHGFKNFLITQRG